MLVDFGPLQLDGSEAKYDLNNSQPKGDAVEIFVVVMGS